MNLTVIPVSSSTSCSVCGDEMEVGALNAKYFFQGQGDSTCEFLQVAGRLGSFDRQQCADLKREIFDLCECRPMVFSDSPALPTEPPTFSPSAGPSSSPSIAHSGTPSITNSGFPTISPTLSPTSFPSETPSITLSTNPTTSPIPKVTDVPSHTPSSSLIPITSPSVSPTRLPSSTPTSLPSSSPTNFSMPLQYMTRSNIQMKLGNTQPLDEASTIQWKKSTAGVIEKEIRQLLEDNIVTLKVIMTLKMQSLDPSFQTTRSVAPTSDNNRKARENVEGDFWGRRRLQGSEDIYKELHLLFDVDILIRSLTKIHNVDQYIGGAFNSLADQQFYVLELRESGGESFENTLTVGLALPLDPSIDGAEKYPRGINSMKFSLVAGLSGVGIGLLALAVFLLVMQQKRRHRRVKEALEAQAAAKAYSVKPKSWKYDSPMNHEFGGVADDVSTIGDPLPPGTARDEIQDDPTIAGNVSLPWDVQQDINGNMSSRSIDDTSSNLVSKDDCTLENQYNAVAQFEVAVPAGMLGLVLESSVEDGVPIVHAIKPTSPLADLVKIGDALIKVDGIDVAYRHASDVSRLIAKRKDKPIRNFLFSRSPKMQRKPLSPSQEADNDDTQTVDTDQMSRHLDVQADLIDRSIIQNVSFDSTLESVSALVIETNHVQKPGIPKSPEKYLGHIQRALDNSRDNDHFYRSPTVAGTQGSSKEQSLLSYTDNDDLASTDISNSSGSGINFNDDASMDNLSI